MRQRADAQRHAYGGGDLRGHRLFQFQAQLGAQHGHRVADQQAEVLVSGVREGVHRPQGRIDDAQDGGKRRVLAGAVRRGVGHAPIGDALRDPAEMAVVDGAQRRAANRAGAARRVFPDDAGFRSRQNGAERAAVGGEELQVAIQVIGQDEAAQRGEYCRPRR